MTDPKPAETSLAEHVPPLEADHKAALDKYIATNARELSDADFDAMIRLFRQKRRADASARLERDRKKVEKAAKKLAADEKKRLKAEEDALKQGGGEGASDGSS